MSIFDFVNNLPQEEILKVTELKLAKDGKSWVCPECGHGKGGDGIKQKEFNGKLTWHCYGTCGKHFSNVDLIAATLGISTNDKPELARRLKELFPECADETFSFHDKKSARKEKNSAAEPARKNYAKMYEVQQRALPNWLATQKDCKWRGLTIETLKEARAGYNVKYKSVVLPYDDETYFWRAVESKARGVNKGGSRRLYIAEPLKVGANTFNFMTEGEIDALSLKQALGKFFCDKVGVVATGSAQFVTKTVEELNKKYGKEKIKPKFIVVFDNDAAGANAEKMVAALNEAGFPTVAAYFGKLGEKKIDANDVLQRSESELTEAAISMIENYETELAEQEREIKRQEADKKGTKTFSLAEYFSVQYEADKNLAEQYANRETGFFNLDYEAAQIFMPGLYVLGGNPGTGKTTFAWQLVSNLAARGEECIFCSYEMSVKEMFAKTLARELRYREVKREATNSSDKEIQCLSSAELRRGATNADVKKIVEELKSGADKLKVLEISNLPIEELLVTLKEEVDSAKAAGAFSPCIVVDYLQIIPSKEKLPVKERIDAIMLKLKTFQRATNTTLILISAFNRAGSYEANFSSFRESSAIEYSSDVCWGLQLLKPSNTTEWNEILVRAAMKKNPRAVELKCLKNRHGGLYSSYFEYYASSDYFRPCKESEAREIANELVNDASADDKTKPKKSKCR